MAGAYIHIPFCEQRCYYCAFTIAVAPERTWEPYVDRLLREIELAGPLLSHETVYFGGGTPSLLDASSLSRILGALPACSGEITIEANPGTLGREKLERYRDIGINRVSLGVQSFAEVDLKVAGRLHSAEDSLRDFEDLRRLGFANINVDLIAGLPGQRREDWIGNLRTIDRLRPEHVSIYLLELDDWSVWGRRGRLGRPRAALVSEDEHACFYLEAADRLESAGYEHYEISNWARPGWESRHNRSYWTGAAYRGFGVGAHSFDGEQRFWNCTWVREYTNLIDHGRLPIAGQERLSVQSRLAEGLLLGLRQMKGFGVQELMDQLNLALPPDWLERVGNLAGAGLVEWDGIRLKLAPAGWLVANAVIEELLWEVPLSTSAVTR